MKIRPLDSAAASLLAIALLVPAVLRAADEAKGNMLKPTNKVDSWRFEQIEGGKGTITADGDAIAFDVTATDSETWHVQAVQTGLDIADGKDYVLTFKAKADGDKSISLNAMVDEEDWHTIGLEESADLTKEWKDFKFEFKASMPAKEKKNRVTFVLGGDKGKIWLKDATLIAK